MLEKAGFGTSQIQSILLAKKSETLSTEWNVTASYELTNNNKKIIRMLSSPRLTGFDGLRKKPDFTKMMSYYL